MGFECISLYLVPVEGVVLRTRLQLGSADRDRGRNRDRDRAAAAPEASEPPGRVCCVEGKGSKQPR